jgi:hypothetical protein
MAFAPDGAAGPDMGNATLQDADTLRRVAFIHDGDRFHYFAMPGMQTTVIVGVSPDGKEDVD